MGVLSGMLKRGGENFVARELCLFERDGESVSRPQTTSPPESRERAEVSHADIVQSEDWNGMDSWNGVMFV